MRSAIDADLTTRARIRAAAIEVFVRDGFSASIRTVATQADVSPGLVIHHFGSKAALRAECDARILDFSRERTGQVLGEGDSASLGNSVSETLKSLADGGPLLVYVTRVLTEGGAAARSFIDRLVVDTEVSVRAAVAAGTIRPSVDEPARARYLIAIALGALMIDLTMNPPPDPTDGEAILRAYTSRTLVASTEYATQGLFTDNSAFDAVLGSQT